jgi:hypothetical protein
MESANDNQDPWTSLAAATATALQNSNQQQDERSATDYNGDEREEQNQKCESAYIDQRLKEPAAPEKRAMVIRGAGHR